MKFYILLWLRELWIFVYFEQVICHWSGRSTIHVWWWTGILYCGAGCVFVRPLKFCAKTDGLYSISRSSVFLLFHLKCHSCLHLRYPFLSFLLLLCTKKWGIKSWIFRKIHYCHMVWLCCTGVYCENTVFIPKATEGNQHVEGYFSEILGIKSWIFKRIHYCHSVTKFHRGVLRKFSV